MSIRHLGLAAIGAFAAPAVLLAQMPRATGPVNRAPDKNATHIMITAFKSVEKGPNNIGAKAAEEMRDKVEGAFPYKQVYVIPKERIDPQLTASMFSTTEALEPHDSKALATMLRADEYVAGEIQKTATGYRATADLVLTRDLAARQPLGVAEAPKIGDALNVLVKEMKEARKQLDAEKKCSNAGREGKYAEAIEFAKAGIAAYPKATLSRMCLASAMFGAKAPSAEIVKVAEELVALDPRSNVGLRYLVTAYKAENNSDALVKVLTQMMRNDPKNAELANDAVVEITASKNPAIALPIIDTAIAQNPGDPDLLKTRWQILFAMKDTKGMIAQGQELMRLDTAFADTTYFQRTAVAVGQDSQWQQAAAVAAQGVAKFPTNGSLVGLEIQALQRAGQAQQALDKLDKAMASKVAVTNAGAIKLQLLQALNKTPAEIITAAREVIAAGDTTEAVRLLMYNQTAAAFGTAQALIKTDAAQAEEQMNTLILGTLSYLDTVGTKAQKPNLAYLRGAANLVLGASIKFPSSIATKSCPLAKEAKAHLLEAQINLPQGGAAVPAAQLQSLMGMAMQVDPEVDKAIKAFCK